MDMGVYETRTDVTSFEISSCARIVVADTCDPVPVEGNVAFVDFVRDDIDDVGVLEESVGGPSAGGDIDELFEAVIGHFRTSVGQ